MIAISWYILKVLMVSGILSAYYFLILKDRTFHKWNRFYLLFTVVLSLLLPLISIDISGFTHQQSIAVKVLNAVTMDEIVIETGKTGSVFQIDWLIACAYFLVAAFIMGFLIKTLYQIYCIKKDFSSIEVDGITFINTNIEGTPFSFFNSIFWNKTIDLHSNAGQRIFNHEVAHIKEKHSYDKLFVNVVLIFFWIIPFFWIIRKELNMIHEYLADKNALEDGDTGAFAEMILMAVKPEKQFSITNNFFYSPIKRRLMMITKNKNPRVNYVSRLLVLPLAAAVFLAFSLKPARVKADVAYKDPAVLLHADTIPDMHYKGKKVTGLKVWESTGQVEVKYGDGSTEKLTQEEAKERGFVLPPPPPLPPAPPKAAKNPPPPPPPPVPPVAQEVKGDMAGNTIASDTVPERVFTRVEQEAKFPGGATAWTKYISSKIAATMDSLTEKDYGTCIIKFIVDTEGNVSDVRATTMEGTHLAKVSVEAIRSGPQWIPAMQNGHKVNAFRIQPVTLKNPAK